MKASGARARSHDRLWSAYAAEHSSQLRETLIEQYRPLAFALLKRLYHRWDDDLAQVALLGLMEAIDRYDPDSGYDFSSFATPTILGELRHYLRDRSRLVRCPRPLLELRDHVTAKERALAAETGRMPTLAEVADALDVPLDQVVEAMTADEVCRPLSLDRAGSFNDPEQSLTLEECLGQEDADLTRAEARVAWRQMLNRLDPRLRKVIELRYYQDLSQKESAQRLGVSQMQVSRLERRALSRLRDQALWA